MKTSAYVVGMVLLWQGTAWSADAITVNQAPDCYSSRDLQRLGMPGAEPILDGKCQYERGQRFLNVFIRPELSRRAQESGAINTRLDSQVTGNTAKVEARAREIASLVGDYATIAAPFSNSDPQLLVAIEKLSSVANALVTKMQWVGGASPANAERARRLIEVATGYTDCLAYPAMVRRGNIPEADKRLMSCVNYMSGELRQLSQSGFNTNKESIQQLLIDAEAALSMMTLANAIQQGRVPAIVRAAGKVTDKLWKSYSNDARELSGSVRMAGYTQVKQTLDNLAATGECYLSRDVTGKMAACSNAIAGQMAQVYGLALNAVATPQVISNTKTINAYTVVGEALNLLVKYYDWGGVAPSQDILLSNAATALKFKASDFDGNLAASTFGVYRKAIEAYVASSVRDGKATPADGRIESARVNLAEVSFNDAQRYINDYPASAKRLDEVRCKLHDVANPGNAFTQSAQGASIRIQAPQPLRKGKYVLQCSALAAGASASKVLASVTLANDIGAPSLIASSIQSISLPDQINQFDTLSVNVKVTGQPNEVLLEIPKSNFSKPMALVNGVWTFSKRIEEAGDRGVLIRVRSPGQPDVTAERLLKVIADTDRYKPNLKSAAYTAQENGFVNRGYGGQCTAFAWGRAYEVTGKKVDVVKGHAKTWWNSTKLPKGSQPRPHSIVVWEGSGKNITHGHVGFLENVLPDGTLVVNEANVNTYRDSNGDYGGGYDGAPKKLTASEIANRGSGVGKLLGYIYISDSAQLPSIDDNFIAEQYRILRGEFVARLLGSLALPNRSLAETEATAKSLGIISSTLNPTASITRGEAALMIARLTAATDKVVPANPDPNHYANDKESKESAGMFNAVNLLFAAGIASGEPHEATGAGYEFHPKRQLSKDEAGAMLGRVSTFLAQAKLKAGVLPVSPTPVIPPIPSQPIVEVKSAVSTGKLQVNQLATWSLTGVNLSQTGIRVTVQDCDTSNLQVQSPSQAQFSCIPRDDGSKTLSYKVGDKGDLIAVSSFSIAKAPVVGNGYALTNSLIERYALAAGVPPVIVKAIAYQESGWDHFMAPGKIKVSSDGGVGIMQIQGGRPDVSEEEGIRLGVNQLLNKWNLNVSAGARQAVDKLGGLPEDYQMDILENWFVPIAGYNGYSKGGKNYSRAIYAMIESPSAYINHRTGVGASVKRDVIGYLAPNLKISSPDVIPGFSGGDASKIEAYSLCQMVKHGARIHRYVFSNNSVLDVTNEISRKCGGGDVVAPNVNVTSVSANPPTAELNGTMTFTAQVDNPNGVARVELVFADAGGLTVPMNPSGGNAWSLQRRMERAGANRPFEVRVTAKDGRVTSRGGVYSVQGRLDDFMVVVNITNASANPSTVELNGTMTFTAQVDNPSLVAKVELVFADAGGLTVAMSPSGGNAWSLQRRMERAGANRPFEVRVTSKGGRVTSRGGTYTVRSVDNGGSSNLQPWQQQSLDYANRYLADYGSRPLINVAGNTCGQYTFCYAFSRSSPGINLPGGMGTAQNAYNSLVESGRAVATQNFASIPIGAVVFYAASAANGYAGHAALKVNEANVVSQGQLGARDCTITSRPSTQLGQLLGYYAPTSGATTFDPNVVAPHLRITRSEFMNKLATALRTYDPALPGDSATMAQQLGLVSNVASLNAEPILRQDAGRMLDRAIGWFETRGWRFQSKPDGRFDRDPSIGDDFRATARRLVGFGLYGGVQQEDGTYQFHGSRQLLRSEADIVLGRLTQLYAGATKPGHAPIVVNITNASANPPTAELNGTMTFTAQVDNPNGVAKVELVFADAGGLTVAMSPSGGNAWSLQRRMERAGTNRPFEVRVTAKDGRVTSRGGVYSVREGDVQPIVVNITNASANPPTAELNGTMTFTAQVDNPNGVAKVELVFPDAGGLTVAMSPSGGNAWSLQRRMERAGANRPFEVRVTAKDGRVTSRGGVYSVREATPQVHGISPSSARLNTPTIFTVSGNNLPSTLALGLADAECSPSGTQRWSCTPRVVGNKTLIVKDRSGGTKIYETSVSVAR